MMLPRRPLLLLTAFLIASNDGLPHNPTMDSPHRARRDVLELQSREAFPTSEERNGDDSFPSSGAQSPNSWLYKFPPWFHPNNPAPEGFDSKRLLPDNQGHASPGGPSLAKDLSSSLPRGPPPSSADDVSFADVQDGDIIIVSDLVGGRRTGRLENIRVRGDSAFRDELVRTILEAKLLNKGPAPLQTTTPLADVFSGGATPFEVPNSAPQPPPPAPGPTQPFVLQDLGGDFPDTQGFVTTGSLDFGVGTASPLLNVGGGIRQEAAPFLPQPTTFPSFPPAAPQSIEGSSEFRPSPPDLTFAHLPPPNVVQSSPPPSLPQLPPQNPAFNPSPLIHDSDNPSFPGADQPRRPPSVIKLPLKTHLTQGTGNRGQPFITDNRGHQFVTGNRGHSFDTGNRLQPSGPQIEHNDIADVFFRDQQEALLKASDRVRLRGNRIVDDSGESIWIPFIPGVPLPILLQHTLASRRRQRALQASAQFRQRGGRSCIGGCGFSFPSDNASSPPSSSSSSFSTPHSAPSPPLALPRNPSQQPTSIQDIIESDYDTSDELYRRAKANNSFSLTSSSGSNVSRNNGWNIRAFARS